MLKHGKKAVAVLLMVAIATVCQVPALAEPEEIHVTVRVAAEGSRGVILERQNFAADPEATVFAILQRALQEDGISMEYTGSSGMEYITSVDGISSLDAGPKSGWMFYLNGSQPDVGMGMLQPSDGDCILLGFVEDYERAGAFAPAVSDAVDHALPGTLAGIAAQDELNAWEAFALSLNNRTLPAGTLDWFREDVAAHGGDYRLITDYTGLLLLLRQTGLSRRDFGGYDLVDKVSNFEQVGKQGLNGYLFALLILSGEANLPDESRWTPDTLLAPILAAQNEDGGFALTEGEASEVDLTAMALDALAPYRDAAEVADAVARGLDYLAAAQNEDGSFSSMGQATAESTAQVLIALCETGEGLSDRFIKNWQTPLDVLLRYQAEVGGFAHTEGGPTDRIATQQAALALTACRYFLQGKGGIYHQPAADMPAFADMAEASGWAVPFLQQAKAAGITQGDDRDRVLPQRAVTRAEFASMLLRTLGISETQEYSPLFGDVPQGAWYWGAVLKAQELGFVTGMGGGLFCPDLPVTRQDMAVMLQRALQLSAGETSGFRDEEAIAPYAREAVGAVSAAGILQGDGGSFHPADHATREMAITVMVRVLELQQ